MREGGEALGADPSASLRRVLATAVRRLAWRFAIALVLCSVLVGAAVVEVNRYIDDEVDKLPRVDLALPASSGSGTNFLIVGSDSRAFVGEDQSANSAFGNTSDSGPPKSDTLMVLHADGKKSYAVSFPRDLWVDVPGHGKAKINSALNDGPQKVVATLQQNFGLPIDHYVQVDFETFRSLVDAVGGIRVWVPYPARNDHTGFNVVGAGCWPLDGDRALAYVRSRAPYYQYLIDGRWVQADPVPDIGRIERQQAFVKKLARLTIDKMTDDPASAPDLADKVIPDLTVDRSFDRAAANTLARAMLAEHDGTGLVFDTLPWTGGRADGQDVLFVDKPAAAPVLARLKGEAEIPAATSTTVGSSPTSAPAVRPVDVQVRVLNGTGKQGAAADASSAFDRLGFVNGGIGNDSRGAIDHTEVRYQPGADAKAALVASHLPGARLVEDQTLGGAVVVALGADFKGVDAKTSSGGGSGSASGGASSGGAAATTTTQPALTPEQQCEAS